MRKGVLKVLLILGFVLLSIGINYADTKAAIASATASTATGNVAAYSCDGNNNTRWESATADPQWIYWDLGSAQPLSKIIIDWESASAKYYTIQGSADASTWTVLASVTNTVSMNHRMDTNAISGTYRYVKMAGTARTTAFAYSIWEASIYTASGASSVSSAVLSSSSSAVSSSAVSSSIVSSSVSSSSVISSVLSVSSSSASSVGSGAKVTVTAGVASTYANNNTAALSFDGSNNTRWESASTDPQWIYWDLGAATPLSRIIIDWESASAKYYTIQGSADASAWTVLASVTNTVSMNHRMDTNAISGTYRYIKMAGTARTTSFAYSIWEVSIYTIAAVTSPSSSSAATSVAVSSSVISSSSIVSSSVSSAISSSKISSSVSSVVAYSKSPKRGIAYDITVAADLIALTNGVSWWFDWSPTPATEANLPPSYYQTYGMDPVPMLWDNNVDTVSLENYILAHPEVKYFMVLNEPNLTGQALRTPQQAAADWPKYEKVVADMAAQGRTVQIVGPQLCWGDMAGYQDPVVWMDNFISSYKAANGGRSPEVDYIGFHWYDYGIGIQLDRLKRFGKKVWVTEMANWHSETNWKIDTQDKQMQQMWDMVNTCESRDDVFRYAWFTGRCNPDPFFTSLFTNMTGQLNPLGNLYTNLPYQQSAPLAKSAKRGVAFDITNSADMGSINNGVSWWFDWSPTPGTEMNIGNFSVAYGMEPVPMLWDNNVDTNALMNYILAHPEVKYFMVLNEPNLSGQALRTPQQAAADWPKYEKVVTDLAARGRTVKIVGPQLCWGDMTGFQDPVVWMDAFLSAYQSANNGRSPEVDCIGFHWYDYGLGSQLDRLDKYGKPIWVTEMANWHWANDWKIDSLFKQEACMVDMINTCEARNDVYRYAWFTGRMNPDPYYTSLLTANAGELTELGRIYTNLPFSGQSKVDNSIFGPNVYVFDPSMPAGQIQGIINQIYSIQQHNQFGYQRYAVMFKPGNYPVDIPLGYYTSIYGLGQSPNDVCVSHSVYSEAVLPDYNATCNFWRSVENFSEAQSGNMKWAVSQACPFRRMHIYGGISLHDNYGWASGGFIADSLIDGAVDPGSQQQWISRNSQWGSWTADPGLWNMVFVGMVNAPSGSWPTLPYTTVAQTPVVREKPYLYLDAGGAYSVFVPSLVKNTVGASWYNKTTPGTSISLSQFYVAKEGDSAAIINAALDQGRNIIFTPGNYYLDDTIRINRANTVVLGLGYATLVPNNGITAMSVADVDGVTIAGLLFDAGVQCSSNLLEVGPKGSSVDHSANPTLLADLFFRVGGANLGRVENCLTVNCNNVIGDNFWIWRADHGDNNSAGWNINTANYGIVVNGNNVTLYGLFSEHFEKNEVLWNGNGGRTYFYQSELPYDVPSQAAWMDGNQRGYASYKVANTVTSHEAWGLGVYSIFISCSNVTCDMAMQAPPSSASMKFHHMVTVHLAAGTPSIAHIINNLGNPVGVGLPYLQTWSDY